MPLCQVFTNLLRKDIPPQFILQLSSVISKILSKPEERVTVMLQTDLPMCRGGSTEPLAQINIWAIGVFSQEKNVGYCSPLQSIIQESLKIPKDRVSIFFHDLKPEQASAHLLS